MSASDRATRSFRRRLRTGFGGGLLAVAMGLVAASAAAQDVAKARGELRDDFGRLVLDWGKATPPALEVDLSETQMVLRFDRPVAVDTAAVRANLKAYFRAAMLSEDGRTLTLPLKKPVTYRLTSEGGRLTLDLGQPGEAKFDNGGTAATFVPAAPTPAPAPQPVPATQPPDGPTLRIRTGEHGGYSRLAIDWPGVAFTTRQNGEQVELAFNAPGAVDLAALARRLPPRLRNAEAKSDASGNLVLTFNVQPNVTAAGFRNGDTVVLDLRDGAPPVATAEPTPPAPSLPEAEIPAPVAALPSGATEAAPAPATAPAPVPEPEAPVAEQTSPAMPLPALESALPVADSPAPATPAATPAPAPAVAPPVVVTKEPAVTPQAAPPAPVEIAAKATPADNGVALAFSFSEPAALAVFKRGDALWLAFDRPGPLDAADLVREAPILTGLARVETPYGTVLRLPDTSRLGGDKMGAVISGDGRQWQVSLGPNRNQRPGSVVEQRRESLGNGGTSLLLQVNAPAAAIELPDPEAGDRLAIIPVSAPGLGLAEGADWPDFRVLASYQGIAVVPISERTRIDSLPNGVVVTTNGDNVLKPVAETEPPPAETPPAAAAQPEGTATETAAVETAPVEGAPAPSEGLFDLAAWRQGGAASFYDDDEKMRAAVEEAPPSQKPAANLALAEFRFAHARFAEAIEALDQLKETPLENDRLVQTLRGAAEAMMGRKAAARQSLARPDLAKVLEAVMFRAYLDALDRDWVAAAEGFKGALPNLDEYPKPARMALRRAAAEALIEHGDPLTAQTFLDGIRLDAPNAEEQAYYDYLSGRQQMRMGNNDVATEAWRKLADSPVPEVRARSQFDLTELELADGKIDTKQAAAALEKLRFVWRGTDFEFDLLYRLGELYLASDQPRRGLTTLRQAATNYPTNPLAKNATDAMAQAFRDLYLGNKADNLPPLTAVALYDEFRELTPSGIDGDRMITALADRLVKVDLLDGAAKLLENQVTKRLAGLDKARAGTRWAAVSLLDNKPDEALLAIKESEVEGMPPDLLSQRRRLQGRALFETGDTLQGLSLIRSDNSLDGLWLKADLQWRLREWPAAAAALGDLIRAEAARLELDLPSEPTADDVAADPAAALVDPVDAKSVSEQRDQLFTEKLAPLVLNQATALSLANDRGGLRRLGRAFGPAMAKGPYATAFATLTSPSANLADSITAAMQSVDQLGAFVEDYRTRLRAASLSSADQPGL